MDDALVARWRQGDPVATRRLREVLGQLAEALIASSSLGFGGMGAGGGGGVVRDRRTVQEASGRVVEEVLERGPAPWAEIRTRCIVACCHRVLALSRLHVEGDHPSVGTLMGIALEQPIGLQQPMDAETEQEVNEHSRSCADCTDALRIIGEMRRRAEGWEPVFEPEEHTDPGVEPRRARPRRTPRQVKTDSQAWPGIFEAWPIIILAVVGAIWMWRTWDARPTPIDLRVAALVDRTPPAPPDRATLPQSAGDVVRDLKRGDCWTASARVRGIRRSVAEHPGLRLLEGRSFICTGNGPAAVDAVAPLLETADGGEAAWILAQAALLEGDIERARELLEMVIALSVKWRPHAELLLRRMDGLTGG